MLPPGNHLDACSESAKDPFDIFTDPEKDEAGTKNSWKNFDSSLATSKTGKEDLGSFHFGERPATVVNINEKSSFEGSNTSSPTCEQGQNHLQPKQFVRKPTKLKW